MKNDVKSLALMTSSLAAMGADMSTGAANFYCSDKVTAQKITFNDRYNMAVARNLFVPENLNQNGRARLPRYPPRAGHRS